MTATNPSDSVAMTACLVVACQASSASTNAAKAMGSI